MRRAAILLLGASLAFAATAAARSDDPQTLRAPADFAGIADPAARSVALFQEMGKVIESPRCLNCHPRGDSPTQGDLMRLHSPPVVRGRFGMGAAGMACSTCHGAANADFANGEGSIPGNPKWMLAPAVMAWQHKTLGEICRQMRDPATNGGKTLADLIEHDGKDSLVGWGWHPGKGRKPAPGTQAAFGVLTEAWVKSGAQCPA